MMILAGGYASACSSDEADPQVTPDTEDSDEGSDTEPDLGEDVPVIPDGDTGDETDSESTDSESDSATDSATNSDTATDTGSNSDSETDAVSYPFDVAIVTSGCEQFDSCGIIDQFGGSIDDCLEYAFLLLNDGADCIDELEASFGCAGDVTSCSFGAECGTETQALEACRNPSQD